MNIEEDIKILKDIVQEVFEFVNDGYECNRREVKAIKNILTEREQDKARIKELEKERDNYKGCFIVTKENSIPRQKVEDKIDEIEKEIIKYIEHRKLGVETDVEYSDHIINIATRSVLQELLEDKGE